MDSNHYNRTYGQDLDSGETDVGVLGSVLARA